jgi:sn-glycerol 3-phosphate transport system substrate-binding protein
VSTTPLALPVDPVIVENWLNGAGVQIVDHGNGRQERAERATLDDPRAERIYEWLRTMGQERLLQPMGGVTADSTLPGSTLSTASGTSAPVMTIASSTTITGVAPTSVEGAPDLDVAPLPGLDNPGRGQIGGVGWYLVRSDRPEVEAAAWDFLRFLDTQASQITFNVRGSYLPFDVRTIDDPALQAVWQSSRRGPWLDTAYTQLTNMDPSSPGPLIGPYDETQDAIRQSIEAVLAGGQPAAVLATANVAIDAALAAYRVPPP